MSAVKDEKKKTETEDEKLYSIGEVSSICNISKKALRFYDKIHIISPDYISEENNTDITTGGRCCWCRLSSITSRWASSWRK